MRSADLTGRRLAAPALGALCIVAAGLATTSCAPGSRVGPGCVDAPRQWTLPEGLPEASGVAVSRRHDGIVWVLNDGPEGVLWALAPDSAEPGTELAPVARVQVATEIWDWEALEVGACPTGLAARSCLWVADTGNNFQHRDVVRLHVLPEPDLDPASAEGRPPVVEPAVVHLSYPDAPRDVEALFVVGSIPWLVSKGNADDANLYRVPLPAAWAESSADAPLTAEKVQELAPGGLNLVRQFTGAATVPGAHAADEGDAAGGDAAGAPARVLIRSYIRLQLYEVGDDGAVPVEGGEVNLLSLREPQGEGVAVGADGRVWLVSEAGPTGGRAGLSAVRCSELEGG